MKDLSYVFCMRPLYVYAHMRRLRRRRGAHDNVQTPQSNPICIIMMLMIIFIGSMLLAARRVGVRMCMCGVCVYACVDV